ncbi:hypothetical protein PG984_007197 [Apiospora sp. TS-2023a]
MQQSLVETLVGQGVPCPCGQNQAGVSPLNPNDNDNLSHTLGREDTEEELEEEPEEEPEQPEIIVIEDTPEGAADDVLMQYAVVAQGDEDAIQGVRLDLVLPPPTQRFPTAAQLEVARSSSVRMVPPLSYPKRHILLRREHKNPADSDVKRNHGKVVRQGLKDALPLLEPAFVVVHMTYLIAETPIPVQHAEVPSAEQSLVDK